MEKQIMWLDKPYHSLDYEVKRRCGKKLYKISLDGGMTCPNRDGRIGYGGCIFCSEGGSGDFAADRSKTIKDRLEDAKTRISKKIPKGKPYGYIAYFQAFTNTYAPVSYLRKIYLEAISDPEVEILSIATRPDCLPDEVLDLLVEINRIKPVWIELGLQTVHERSADWMRRGYALPCFEKAVSDLRRRRIEVIVHVIIGLPGEGKEELSETIGYLNRMDIQGIKLALLHILKGTDLADEFASGKVHALSYEEYRELLFTAIAGLRPEIVIHRITGDGPKNILLAPLWTGNKKMALNTLMKDMKEAGIYQGRDYEENM